MTVKGWVQGRTEISWECVEEIPFPVPSSLISAFNCTQEALKSEKPGDMKCPHPKRDVINLKKEIPKI